MMRLFDYIPEMESMTEKECSPRILELMLQAKERAKTRRLDVLRQIKKLSVDPDNIVLGFDFRTEDEHFCESLKFYASESPQSHRLKLHQNFHRFYFQYATKVGINPCGYMRFPSDADPLPSIPAIYFCCRVLSEHDEQFEVWYIGKAKDLRSRWKSHHKYQSLKAVGVNRIYYQPMIGISDSDVNVLEKLYLMMFMTQFNDIRVEGFESEDLRSSDYLKGFNDGFDQCREDTSEYFSKEISRLHLQILNLQGCENNSRMDGR